MATTRIKRTLDIHRGDGKENIITDRVPGEESAQTYTMGAPLVRDASTKELEEWAGGTNASLIAGIAVADASGTAGATVRYYEANDYTVFEGTLINNATAYVLLGTEVGVAYSLIKSGNDWYIDIADTTTKIAEVVGLISDVGDTSPRVKFRFIGARQANVRQ